MRIGILTFHWADNYGALLQAYGLCETLKKLGNKVELINLRPKREKKDLRYYFISRPFYIFRDKHLPVQKQIFYSSEELRKFNFNHDIYIVGSDQIWNKDITRDQKYSYFFDFLPINKKRITYAASFGLSEWMFNKEETNSIKELINKFQAISVRENTGKNLSEEYLGVNASVVLDPTLLLGDFSNLINSKTKTTNEIACFKFKQDKKFYNFARELMALENKKIRLLNNNLPVRGFKWSPFASVPHLITRIKQASLVVTDSFHITCLAIIFKKPMIILPANPKRTGRITDLFKALNIENHFYHSYDEALEKKNWRKKINYQQVNALLNILRDDSTAFLKKNLK